MKNYYLLQQLIIKDFREKYKGSVLGVLWSIIIPLFMMVIYTFVFSEIFQPVWSAQPSSKFEYALIIFCGLSAFNMFSEVMTRSTGIISENVNYVKKVIFPLELLPMTVSIVAFVNCIISYVILLVGNFILTQTIYITSFEMIFLLIPLLLTCLGISYALAALSVYFKDIVNAISVVVMILMYASPIFYSLEAAPKLIQFIAFVNPLAYIIENARKVCIYGEHMNINNYLISLVVSGIILFVGYQIFDRLKVGFADVL